MHVLVTGTSGFVGSAIAQNLREAGHRVHGLSRTASREGCVDTHTGHDLRQKLPQLPRFDAVVHCAALASPWARPSEFVAANVEATQNVLRWAAAAGAPHLVFISTTAVHYERCDQFDLDEDSALPEPSINDYAKTKKAAEAEVARYPGKWIVLRPRAVYGPGDTVLLPRILRAAKEGKLPRLVRPDGKRAMGDLLYIENLTGYVRAVVEKTVTGKLILTNNSPVDMQAFLELVLQRLGYPVPKGTVSVRTAMAFARVAEVASALLLSYREPPITRFGVSVFAYSKTFNVRRSVEALGPPAFSNEEGLARFVDWWAKHGA